MSLEFTRCNVLRKHDAVPCEGVSTRVDAHDDRTSMRNVWWNRARTIGMWESGTTPFARIFFS